MERTLSDDWQLAQLDIAHLAAPLDSPQLAEFVANLDRVNALAESAEAFTFRSRSPVPAP